MSTKLGVQPRVAPSFDKLGPTFGQDDHGLAPRQVQLLPDAVLAEVDAVKLVRQFPG